MMKKNMTGFDGALAYITLAAALLLGPTAPAAAALCGVAGFVALLQCMKDEQQIIDSGEADA